MNACTPAPTPVRGAQARPRSTSSARSPPKRRLQLVVYRIAAPRDRRAVLRRVARGPLRARLPPGRRAGNQVSDGAGSRPACAATAGGAQRHLGASGARATSSSTRVANGGFHRRVIRFCGATTRADPPPRLTIRGNAGAAMANFGEFVLHQLRHHHASAGAPGASSRCRGCRGGRSPPPSGRPPRRAPSPRRRRRSSRAERPHRARRGRERGSTGDVRRGARRLDCWRSSRRQPSPRLVARAHAEGVPMRVAVTGHGARRRVKGSLSTR